MKIHWRPIEDAPYNVTVLLLFENGVINSGKKVSVPWIKYGKDYTSTSGVKDEFIPVGVESTHCEDLFFLTDPIKWWADFKK